MKHHFKKALAVLTSVVMILTSVLIPSTAFAQKNTNKNYVEGEIIAVLSEDAGSEYTKAATAKKTYGSGYSVKSSFTFGNAADGVRAVVLKSKALTAKQMIKQVEKNAAVEYAFPNYKMHATSISDDTYSQFQWALDNQGQNGGTAGLDTNADTLWENAAASDKEQVIAIVDTGIDYENEDLKDIVWNNPYGKKLLGKHGMDFTGTIKDGEPYDDNGHGTHCAGIIAAQANNQKGISGINQSNVKIMALKFLEADGSGTTEAALAAYEYLQRAVKLGTNVIACNNSWGGGADQSEIALFDEIYDELGKLGVINFAAAGNESTELGTYDEFWEETLYEVPACCNSPYCVTVAASNEKDELADFSNYSKEYVDVAAPGTDILSTVSYNCFNPTLYTDEQKAALCGTQMQDYDATVGTDDFGYFKLSALNEENFVDGTNYEVKYETGFGMSGSAITFSFKDEIPKNQQLFYTFEVPYTVENETDDYSISIMNKGNNGYEATVYDVPADMTAKDAFEDAPSTLMLWGTEKANYWDHSFADMDVDNEDFEYTPATNRKLVFVIAVFKEGTEVTFDDFAISKQAASADDFGKYDFYDGTSMATPYATGAAALIKNAQPDATILDIINIIKNAGRHSDSLEGKTETAKVLSLDDITRVPPMITGVSYNKKNQVEITGSFVNTESVTVNDAAAEIISSEKNLITIADKNYSTKKLIVKVTNNIGTDEFKTMISLKPDFKETKMYSAPDTLYTVAIPAGETAYFVNAFGGIGMANRYDYDGGQYEYEDIGALDTTDMFSDNTTISVDGATYLGSAIYMKVVAFVTSTSTGATIGYESALVKVDLETFKSTAICELPDEALFGSSIATYNGEIYVIGGNDDETYKCYDTVYKLDEKGKKLVKQTATLPEGRAAMRFLQYKDKLVGMYGRNDAGTFPSILIYDGKSWKESKVKLESDDAFLSLPISETETYNSYTGNLGYGKDGIFAVGAYVYNVGDTFTYNVDKDTVTPSKYSHKKALSDSSLIGTTVPGGFIGFASESIFEDIDLSVGSLARAMGDAYGDYIDDDGDNEGEDAITAYTLDFNTSYPEVDTMNVEHGYVSNVYNYYYNYGDKVCITVKPDAGYAVTSIKSNSTVLSKNSNSAALVVKEPKSVITTTSKLVSSPITSLKVSKTTANSYTLNWNKAKYGTGYEIQQYKNNKWTTVKTIKNLNTTTYKVTAKAGTAKYRVRVYGTYNSKTVYGTAKSKTINVPKKQTIKSVSGAKKAFTVKYTKNKNATGYEIQYSKNKNFKSAKTVTVKKNTTVSKKIAKLAKGKYYVRVRSYKSYDGKKVYGAYSAAKTVNVK